MIIETMEQLGKCIDDDVELERQGYPSTDRSWEALQSSLALCNLEKLIEDSRIRTKPHTVDVQLVTVDGKPVDIYLTEGQEVPINAERAVSFHTITLED